MRRYLARRLAQTAGVVFLVVTVVFFLLHLAPGDPFGSAMENSRVTEAVRARWRASYGLDQPLPEQYLRWVANTARGDLGWSFSLNRPVSHALRQALPNTLLLMGTALLLSFSLGVTIGIAQAVRRGSAIDRALGAVSLFFYSMPDFWLALMAMLVFAYWLPIFPVTGMVDAVMHEYLGPSGKVLDVLRHLALPALTLAVLSTASIARYQRSAMLDVIGEDYMRTARAKGVGERAVMLRHGLRNALIPVITLLGLSFPALLAGAVFVEKVFAWPGMGFVTVNAIGTRDYPLVLAAVLVSGTMVAAGSLAADLLYTAADPRLRRG